MFTVILLKSAFYEVLTLLSINKEQLHSGRLEARNGWPASIGGIYLN